MLSKRQLKWSSIPVLLSLIVIVIIPIANNYGLTSFDFINLICIIEKKYNVELDEKDYKNMNTVDDLIKYLDEKC